MGFTKPSGESDRAFPLDAHQAGMTLRDYFAAKALQGFIASGDMNMDIASLSYRYADAMLKARDA